MSEERSVKGDILIVDDNEINQRVLSALLKKHNYQTRVVGNGILALATVQKAIPDLIMLDINMPDIDGFEVCRLLKLDPDTSRIPIIFVSGSDTVMDKVKAFELGGVDYVTKPFQFEEILARVDVQVKIHRQYQEVARQNAELAKRNDELKQLQDSKIIAGAGTINPGRVLDGRYRLERKIGEGGFGQVFEAFHLGLQRLVAIKIFRPVLNSSYSEGLERFKLEGVSACRVNHPNAISIIDFNITDDGIAYLVMELLNGDTLGNELYQKRQLTVARSIEVLVPVCQALDAAHKMKIVHRDIKPDNIFLHKTKEGEVVKVVDFGIAKLLDDAANAQNLTQGGIVGTPQYMSPERLLSKKYDGRADVYSVGVMLFKMLAGQVPFNSPEGTLATAVMHIHQPVPSLKQYNANVPSSMEEIIKYAMAKDPNDRPTANELAELLIQQSKKDKK